MPSISISLRAETAAALQYLLERWYDGAGDKRNATIQRALLEAAQREGMAETTR